MSEATSGAPVRVEKYDWQGRFCYAWQAAVRRRGDGCLLLEARWQGPGEPAVGKLQFVQGDRFLEFYYPGRHYAIWQVEDRDGRLKGWYCNVSTPVREDASALRFRDLLLDLLVYPDGSWSVLDREELEQARRQGLAPDLAEQAEAAIGELLALLEQRVAPFDRAGPARREAV